MLDTIEGRIERVRAIMNKYGLNASQFAEKVKIDRSNLSSMLNGSRVIGDGVMNKILISFDNIERDWLFEGKGKMLKSKIESNATFLENPNFIMVSVVGQYAAAGYLNGFADEEYIDELPKVPFFIDHEVKGKYMGFEVRGDSMDNNSTNSIAEGDTLICRQIKPELWCNKLHIQKWYFVIVHKEEGIIVKQIIDHNPETGDITIHSLNSFYPDRVLNLRDVAQLFNVVQIVRKPRL